MRGVGLILGWMSMTFTEGHIATRCHQHTKLAIVDEANDWHYTVYSIVAIILSVKHS